MLSFMSGANKEYICDAENTDNLHLKKSWTHHSRMDVLIIQDN